MTSKNSGSIIRVFLGFILGYVVAIITIIGCDKSDSIPRPVLQSLVTTPFTEWVRDSRAVMVSYSLGERKRSGLTFNLSQPEAKRLGDALAADLPSRSNEGRLSFRDHFDLVFLGGSRLTQLKYDVAAGAALISSEGYEGMTVTDTSFLRELLPLIQKAEQAVAPNGP